MPAHTCTSRDLTQVVAQLEANGERVVAGFAANEDSYVLITETKPRVGRPAKGVETR